MIKIQLTYYPEHKEEELHISLKCGNGSLTPYAILQAYDGYQSLALPDNIQIVTETKLKNTIKA